MRKVLDRWQPSVIALDIVQNLLDSIVTCSFLRQRPTTQLKTVKFYVANVTPSIFDTVVIFVPDVSRIH